MDIKSEILLGSKKNINAVNVNNYGIIELTNNVSKLTEFTVNDVVNSTEVFDAEREANQVYRIYGRIEYLSLLNGLKTNYSKLEDFFNSQLTGNIKNLKNSFKFYIVAPHSGVTYSHISGTDKYERSFLVLTNENDIEIYNAGFTNNVYGEQVYAFSFKVDFDVSEYYDKLGFPLTELFLYVQYIKATNEKLYYTTWSTSNGLPTKTELTTKTLIMGDDVKNAFGINIMDIIEYIPEEYLQTQVSGQTFFIRTPYIDGSTKYLEWSYNPFIPFRLRYLDSVVSRAKLSEIIENSTALNVYLVSNPTFSITATKTEKQSITTALESITNWNLATGPFYSWNAVSGELVFLIGGTYDINFNTSIYLPNETDKYIAEIYMEEYVGTFTWIEIPNTRRKISITNTVEGIRITKRFNNDDSIRIKVRLIPNPEIRKMFEIPDYALMIKSSGKYVWRDILPQGYIDPLTSEGVNYPFFNKRRYLFSPIILDVAPNLSENTWENYQSTINAFKEISYSKNATTKNTTPLTELNDIGKPCR